MDRITLDKFFQHCIEKGPLTKKIYCLKRGYEISKEPLFCNPKSYKGGYLKFRFYDDKIFGDDFLYEIICRLQQENLENLKKYGSG